MVEVDWEVAAQDLEPQMPAAGIDLAPHWKVLPPWVEPEAQGHLNGVPLIRIRPGEGFGLGTHATTQLCLLALGELASSGFRLETALDFGSGSGILAIGAARSGARVEAVEANDQAIANAQNNAELNGVEGLIDLRPLMSEPPSEFDLVVANVLAPVLLEFAEELCARQSPRGRMIVSGLEADDVPEVVERFGRLLAPMKAEVLERDVWRALVFAP